MKNIRLIVNEEDNLKRLDIFISSLDSMHFTRSKIQKLIKQGNIYLVNKGNKEVLKSSYKVKTGDEIVIEENEEEEIKAKPQDIPIDIIYEDNDIIIINKKQGMVVHPGNGNIENTLVNAVLAYSKNKLSRNWRKY